MLLAFGPPESFVLTALDPTFVLALSGHQIREGLLAPAGRPSPPSGTRPAAIELLALTAFVPFSPLLRRGRARRRKRAEDEVMVS
jgi:hypothetical protein